MSKIGFTDTVDLPVLDESESIFRGSTFHLARVTDLNDSEGIECRVECPGLLGAGEHRTVWASLAGLPVGTTAKDMKGDCGIWWPPVVGEYVLLSGSGIAGNEDHRFAIRGPIGLQDENAKAGEALVPAEVNSVAKNKSVRESTRIRMLKSEAGHTLMFCDNEGEEGAFLMDSVGQTIFFTAPSKGKGEKETKDTKISSPRSKDSRREDKSCVDGSCKKPGECTKNGLTYCGFLDINGSGLVCIGQDGKGSVAIKASKEAGDNNPLSIVLDTENKQIILTAGDTQFRVDGKRGHTYSTSQIVQEHVPINLKPYMEKMYNDVKTYFQKMLGKSGGGSGSGSSGGSQSSSSNTPSGPESNAYANVG